MRNIIRFRVLFLMMLPALAIVIFNNYIPMFGVVLAFKNYNFQDGIWHSPWVGWENFKYLVQTDVAWTATRNTIGFNAVFIVLNTLGAVAVAIGLNEIRGMKLKRTFQSTILFPYFISYVAVSYILYAILGQAGFLNSTVLKFFGMDAVSWYAEVKTWFFILPIVNTWKHVGYFAVVYLAAIVSIDTEYYEAALIDGASKFRQMLHITLPMLAPVVIVMVLLQISRIFNADFGLFYQAPLNSGSLLPATEVIDTFVYRNFLLNGNVGMSAAAGFYQASVGFVLVLLTNLVVRRVSKENALF
ncbi:ABC transporter permease [Paenibacillus roseipurpureus]|uniref:ABC transporter permease subunit n=1 Tax=Paenibacillus roseopurpureus TaxID=2918901 RepID=A0AA96LQ13_9BACL|nr:ABC transporter permease subunit [Paenibacillus sp. MBLB1832]WNR46157.1 ABC transporter permease subunit [Paenibacillus sp. MBLB1832]